MHAPINSAEVERGFSAYKEILSDDRHSFCLGSLKKHVILRFNKI